MNEEFQEQRKIVGVLVGKSAMRFTHIKSYFCPYHFVLPPSLFLGHETVNWLLFQSHRVRSIIFFFSVVAKFVSTFSKTTHLEANAMHISGFLLKQFQFSFRIIFLCPTKCKPLFCVCARGFLFFFLPSVRYFDLICLFVILLVLMLVCILQCMGACMSEEKKKRNSVGKSQILFGLVIFPLAYNCGGVCIVLFHIQRIKKIEIALIYDCIYRLLGFLSPIVI